MNQATSRILFPKAAVAAFPWDQGEAARNAIAELEVAVDDSHPCSSERLQVEGAWVNIPKRLRFREGAGVLTRPEQLWVTSRCLLTRATDGHLRHKALLTIIDRSEPWIVPFVVLLLGDYVVEIVREIEAALPRLDRAAYIDLIRENRAMTRLLRSRTISYWDAYYRNDYPSRATYPGLVVLNQFDLWAA